MFMKLCRSSTVAVSRLTPCSFGGRTGAAAAAGVPARTGVTTSAAATRTVVNRPDRRIFYLQGELGEESCDDHCLYATTCGSNRSGINQGCPSGNPGRRLRDIKDSPRQTMTVRRGPGTGRSSPSSDCGRGCGEIELRTAESVALGDLLECPGVAVRVRERHEGAPGLHVDVARIHALVEQRAAGRRHVRDHHLYALLRSWRHLGHALAEHDRARGTGRRQLHETQPLAHRVVVVGVEADLVNVERFGPVDVRHRDRDKLDLPIHPGTICGVYDTLSA